MSSAASPMVSVDTGGAMPATVEASLDSAFDQMVQEAGGDAAGSGSGADSGGGGEGGNAGTAAVEVSSPEIPAGEHAAAAVETESVLPPSEMDELLATLEDLEAAPAEAAAGVTKPAEAAAKPAAEASTTEGGAEAPKIPAGFVERTTKGGAKEWVVSPARGAQVAAGYETAQLAESVFGEPVTKESLQQRQDAHHYLQTLDDLTLSDNPQHQAKAIGYLLNQAAAAGREKVTAHDPMATMGTALYDAVAAHPELDAAIAGKYTDSLIEYLYAGGAAGDAAKLKLAQNLELAMRGTFRKKADLAPGNGSQPIAPRQRPAATDPAIAEREAGLAEREKQLREASFNTFKTGTVTAVKAKVSDTIKEALGNEIVTRLGRNPEILSEVITKLEGEVKKQLAENKAFRSAIDAEYNRARLAGRDDVRESAKNEIVRRYAILTSKIVQASRRAAIEDTMALHNGRTKLRVAHADRTSKARPAAATGAPATPAVSTGVTEREPGTLASTSDWEKTVDAMFAGG